MMQKITHKFLPGVEPRSRIWTWTIYTLSGRIHETKCFYL